MNACRMLGKSSILICGLFVLMQDLTRAVVISPKREIKADDFVDTLVNDYQSNVDPTTIATELFKPIATRTERPVELDNIPTASRTGNSNNFAPSNNGVNNPSVSFVIPANIPANNFFNIPSGSSPTNFDSNTLNTILSYTRRNNNQANPFLPVIKNVPQGHSGSTHYVRNNGGPWRQVSPNNQFTGPNTNSQQFDNSGPSVYYHTYSQPSNNNFHISSSNNIRPNGRFTIPDINVDSYDFGNNNPNSYYRESSYSYNYNSALGPPVESHYNYDSRNGGSFRVYSQ